MEVTHSCWLNKPRKVASQNLLYNETDIETYLKTYNIRFLYNRDWTADTRGLVQKEIQRKLDAPWYKQRYDTVGIVGQYLHLPVLNIPWLRYCSESVADDIRLTGGPSSPPKHGNPAQLYQWCLDNGFVEYGRYYVSLADCATVLNKVYKALGVRKETSL